MSGKIITLSKQLANQIAAWEVVERPVSVVKELMENSIDAWATKIEIYLEEGGKRLIEVRDNGSGIASEDVEKSIEKYSTSKITNLEDLYSVMTFGFRGEALASISSVSEFTLSSKTSGSIAGTSISINTQGDSVLSERWMEEGTVIEIKNLFYNTPARLHYLKTDRTEYAKIKECVEKMAFSYPEVAFELHHDGKLIQHFTWDMTIKDRMYMIYGSEFRENMRYISHEFSWVRVSGYISDPKISFPNRTRQSLFVNHRSVTSPMISKAIFDAYNRFIAPKTFPGYVLFLDVDPTRVDVNVHPRKLEVRFADEQTVYRSIYHGVKDELERVSLIWSRDSSTSWNIHEWFSPAARDASSVSEPKYYTWSGTKFKNYSPYTNTLQNPAQAGLNFNEEILWNSNPRAQKIESGDIRDTPLGRIIWQVHNSYIVVETSDGLQILDQHAVAERVIYERISKSSYTPKIQQLLTWVWLHINSSEQDLLEEHSETFETLGFEVEVLSHGNILVTSIPDFVNRAQIESVFLKILSDISSVGSKSLDEVRNKIWAYTACRSAVKFGDPLSMFEMNALLRDASMDYSATCPHGRPVIYDVNLEELQKKYER